jgi:hypothetical protein
MIAPGIPAIAQTITDIHVICIFGYPNKGKICKRLTKTRIIIPTIELIINLTKFFKINQSITNIIIPIIIRKISKIII